MTVLNSLKSATSLPSQPIILHPAVIPRASACPLEVILDTCPLGFTTIPNFNFKSNVQIVPFLTSKASASAFKRTFNGK